MQRTSSALAALIASFALGVCAQLVWLSSASGSHERATLQGTVSPDFDLTGFYDRVDEFPLAFNNVRRVHLTTADYHVNPDSSVTRTPIAPKGYLATDLDFYKLSSVDVGGGRLSFTTESSLGVSYRFTGRVLPVGDYPIRGYDQYLIATTVMVEGRMVRMLFGLKVAESEMRFTKGFGC
jgi:hypothetical protein